MPAPLAAFEFPPPPRLPEAGRGDHRHRGVDLGAPLGSPVVAPAAGSLTWGDWPRKGSPGRAAYLTTGEGLFVLGPIERGGEELAKVEAGELIGVLGAYSRGGRPHLHVEFWPGLASAGQRWQLVLEGLGPDPEEIMKLLFEWTTETNTNTATLGKIQRWPRPEAPPPRWLWPAVIVAGGAAIVAIVAVSGGGGGGLEGMPDRDRWLVKGLDLGELRAVWRRATGKGASPRWTAEDLRRELAALPRDQLGRAVDEVV